MNHSSLFSTASLLHGLYGVLATSPLCQRRRWRLLLWTCCACKVVSYLVRRVMHTVQSFDRSVGSPASPARDRTPSSSYATPCTTPEPYYLENHEAATTTNTTALPAHTRPFKSRPHKAKPPYLQQPAKQKTKSKTWIEQNTTATAFFTATASCTTPLVLPLIPHSISTLRYSPSTSSSRIHAAVDSAVVQQAAAQRPG